jgi:hypothetical protein
MSDRVRDVIHSDNAAPKPPRSRRWSLVFLIIAVLAVPAMCLAWGYLYRYLVRGIG